MARNKCLPFKILINKKATFSQCAVSRAAPKVDNIHFVMSVYTARLTARRRTETLSKSKTVRHWERFRLSPRGQLRSTAVESGWERKITFLRRRWPSDERRFAADRAVSRDSRERRRRLTLRPRGLTSTVAPRFARTFSYQGGRPPPTVRPSPPHRPPWVWVNCVVV